MGKLHSRFNTDLFVYESMSIHNAEGNTLSEKVGDTINQVVGSFAEGINAMFAGFKTMSQQGFDGFQANGVQTSSNVRNPNEPPTSDQIHFEMERSKAVMQSEIEFGREDQRAAGGN